MISNVTALARQVEDLIRSGQGDRAAHQIRAERAYPLAPALAHWIGGDADGPPVSAAVTGRLP